MIRKFGGSTGIDIQPQGLDLGIGGSNIKSIQTGTLTFNSGTSITQAIANVDLTKAILSFDFTSNTDTQPQFVEVAGYIVNATTIQFETAGNVATGGATLMIEWKVIEFENVKSLQSGVSTITSGSAGIVDSLISISTVNLSKSLIFASHKTAYINAGRMSGYLRSKFNSSTQIKLSAYWNNYNVTLRWQVIEFN